MRQPGAEARGYRATAEAPESRVSARSGRTGPCRRSSAAARTGLHVVATIRPATRGPRARQTPSGRAGGASGATAADERGRPIAADGMAHGQEPPAAARPVRPARACRSCTTGPFRRATRRPGTCGCTARPESDAGAPVDAGTASAALPRARDHRRLPLRDEVHRARDHLARGPAAEVLRAVPPADARHARDDLGRLRLRRQPAARRPSPRLRPCWRRTATAGN